MLEALGFRRSRRPAPGFAFTLGRARRRGDARGGGRRTCRARRATELPLSVDLENGYGHAEQAARAIERWRRSARSAARSRTGTPSRAPTSRPRRRAGRRGREAARGPASCSAHRAGREPHPRQPGPRRHDRAAARLRGGGRRRALRAGLGDRRGDPRGCAAVSRPVNVLVGRARCRDRRRRARRISVGGSLTWGDRGVGRRRQADARGRPLRPRRLAADRRLAQLSSTMRSASAECRRRPSARPTAIDSARRSPIEHAQPLRARDRGVEERPRQHHRVRGRPRCDDGRELRALRAVHRQRPREDRTSRAPTPGTTSSRSPSSSERRASCSSSSSHASDERDLAVHHLAVGRVVVLRLDDARADAEPGAREDDRPARPGSAGARAPRSARSRPTAPRRIGTSVITSVRASSPKRARDALADERRAPRRASPPAPCFATKKKSSSSSDVGAERRRARRRGERNGSSPALIRRALRTISDRAACR